MSLASILGEIPSVQMGLVVHVEDGTLLDSFGRLGATTDVAVALAAWVRASRAPLEAAGAWSEDAILTVESARSHLVVEVLDGARLLAVGFEPATPKGLARLHCARASNAVRKNGSPPQQRFSSPSAIEDGSPNWPAALAELSASHPNPIVGCARVSLRTGIEFERLHRPGALTSVETALVTEVVQALLSEATDRGPGG